jgi:hypothetical protein
VREVRALLVASARRSVGESGQAMTFAVKTAGRSELATWLVDTDAKTNAGAYHVTVRK